MDHVAIMRKSWELIPKILDGKKKIESRWGKNKCAPWGKVKVGDTIYFKNSCEPVAVAAKVSKIKEFEGLNPQMVRKLLKKYGGDDGISATNLKSIFEWAKEKHYCTLIYLENPRKVTPFNIDKTGFGIGAAWITINKISMIRV